MENEDESPPMDPPETAEQQIEVNEDDGLPVDVGQGLEAFQAERDQMIAEKIQEDNGEAAAFALTSPEEAQQDEPEEAQQDEINDRAADVYNQQPEQPVILQ